MARTYTLKRRAETQAETRQKIVDAAMELHGTIGPARTTYTMVAERAGVQRHTLYAHFPDERSLLLACSARHLEVSPVADPEPWRAIADTGERLRTGLAALYGWFADNAVIAGCLLRDIEVHEPTRETFTLRFGPIMHAYANVLSTGLRPEQRPMLALAMSFHTWRTLTGDGGLDTAGAAAAMAGAIGCAGQAAI